MDGFQDTKLVLFRAGTRSNLDLLRSGMVPSDERETACIEQDVRDLEHAQAALRTDIEFLFIPPVQLWEQQVDVNRQLAISRAMLAPIRRLPPEIFSKIFEHVVAAIHRMRPKMPIRTEAMNFAMVCKLWHTITLETPQLWTTINVGFSSFESVGYWQRAIDVHVERSGQLPLRLHFTFDPIGDCFYWDNMLWELLCSHSHRWSEVSLGDPPLAKLSGGQWRWPRQLPTLATLIFDNSSWGSDPPFHMFSSAPITSLTLCYRADPCVVAALPSSWNIARLVIDCQDSWEEVDTKPFLYSLATCSPRLQHLEVTALRISRIPPSVAHLSFPMLERMQLSYEACRLASCMTAPKLCAVTLRGCDREDRNDARLFRHFVQMLPSTSDSLRALTLIRFGAATRVIIQCLDLIRSLASLRIEAGVAQWPCAYISRGLLSALVRDPEDPVCMGRLPRLANLAIIVNLEKEDSLVADRLREVFFVKEEGLYVRGNGSRSTQVLRNGHTWTLDASLITGRWPSESHSRCQAQLLRADCSLTDTRIRRPTNNTI